MSPTGRDDPRGRHRGVALLSVMFILVLLTTMAVYVTEADHLMLSRAGNQRNLEQGMQLALGGEQWAVRVLQRDAADSEIDHLNESWNRLDQPVSVEDADMRTAIEDMQGRFNVNNLTRRDEVWYPAFKRLLRLLDIDEGIAEAVVDWIDADQQRTHASGAEDLEYLLFDPPYRAANRRIADLGELLLVEGVTEDVLTRLTAFVTAIPDDRETRININTCPPLLFQAMAGVDAAAAEALADGRGEEGYESVEVFLQRPELAGEAHLFAEPMISLSSDFFMVTNQARIDDMNLAIDSVVRRSRASGQIEVLSRAWGYL